MSNGRRRRTFVSCRALRSGSEQWRDAVRLNGHVRGGLGRSRGLAGHEIGHTGIGFQATQQLHAGIQEVIDLSLVIASLALALGEDHIVDRIRIEIGQRPYIVFGHAVNAQCGRRLVHNLVDQTIHLLLIIRRLLGRSGLEAFALVTLRMVLDFVIQLLGLRLPRHTPMLCYLPCGLLIDHGTFQTSKRGVNLCDHIAVLAQIKGHVLNVMLGEIHALAVIQSMGALQESVHLSGVIPPLALARTCDARLAVPFTKFLRHRLFDLLLDINTLPQLYVTIETHLTKKTEIHDSVAVLPVSFCTHLTEISEPLPRTVREHRHSPYPWNEGIA